MQQRYYHRNLETLRIVVAAVGKKPIQDPEVRKRCAKYQGRKSYEESLAVLDS